MIAGPSGGDPELPRGGFDLAEKLSLKNFFILEVSGFRSKTMNERTIQSQQEVHARGYSEAPWHFI